MKRPPLFVKGDLDGFFGLFIDNMVQLLLIVALLNGIGMTWGVPGYAILVKKILPGAAISILLGNLFYAWQARRLAKQTGREDVTALPYGINTPSLLIYFFFVMLPVYQQSGGNTELAWKMGMLACLGSGVIELLGSLVGARVRKWTPRAALLSTLAGIAIGFISMTFALQIYQNPLIAMLPLGIIFLGYFGRIKFPYGLPGGLLAVLVGTLAAWIFPWVFPEEMAGVPRDLDEIRKMSRVMGLYLPQLSVKEIFSLFSEDSGWLGYMAIVIPMGLFNVLGSMQNVESAEAAGDSYPTGTSMAMNGLGSVVAACFGSCFPTTIYIGHPGWKEMGARSGYSTLNGLVITVLCLTGMVGLISSIVPLEAGIAIVLWIGIIITAQSFQATPKEHAPAVAVGLFPAIAAWGATVALGAYGMASRNGGSTFTLQQILEGNLQTEFNGFLIHGMLLMERGYIFTCMILSAMTACLIERNLRAAAVWAFCGAGLTLLGLTHAYQLKGDILDYLLIHEKVEDSVLAFRAYGIVIGYLMMGGLFLAFWHWGPKSGKSSK